MTGAFVKSADVLMGYCRSVPQVYGETGNYNVMKKIVTCFFIALLSKYVLQ